MKTTIGIKPIHHIQTPNTDYGSDDEKSFWRNGLGLLCEIRTEIGYLTLGITPYSDLVIFRNMEERSSIKGKARSAHGLSIFLLKRKSEDNADTAYSADREREIARVY